MCRILLTLFLGLVVGVPAWAQTPDPIPPAPEPPAPLQLVGFTTATFDGAEGVLGFTAACQIEFGAGSRMCSSVEVMETTTLPSGLAGEAWVRPVHVPISLANGDTSSRVAQADSSGGWLQDRTLSCRGWSDGSSSPKGLFMDENGRFPDLATLAPGGCSVVRAVSCCAPVP